MTAKHLASAIQPLFSFESLTATTAFLVSEQAPNGQHYSQVQAVSATACLSSFSQMYFNEGFFTPDNLAQQWPQLYQSFSCDLQLLW